VDSSQYPVKIFQTWLGLANYFFSCVSIRSLDANSLVDVAKETVVTLRLITSQAFSHVSVNRWREVELDLNDSIQALCGNVQLVSAERGRAVAILGELVKEVKRTYPSMILSDFGIELVMQLYEKQPKDVNEQHQLLTELLRMLPCDSGSRLLVTPPK
jgi:hypothetical protein